MYDDKPAGGKPAAPILWLRGKYEGRPLPEIDTGYLQFLAGKYTGKLSARLRADIVAELQARGAAVPAPPPPKANVCWRGPCSRCGCAVVAYRWLQQRDGRRVVRATCQRCSASLGAAPSISPYVDLADRNASPTAVLDAVILAEAEGVELVSDGRTVQCRPWDKASEELKNAVRQQQHLLARMLGKATTGSCTT